MSNIIDINCGYIRLEDINVKAVGSTDAVWCVEIFWCTTMFSKDNNGYTLSLKTAKKCALIMVEEIIELNEGIFGTYWKEVKREIINYN